METISIIGTLSAIFISTLVLFYNAGKVSARVESLESWRGNIRNDMHEISEDLEAIKISLSNLEVIMRDHKEAERLGR